MDTGLNEEQIVMGIIMNGGDARSKAIKAIQEAKAGKITNAENLLIECKESLNKAHKVQTELIQEEIRGTDKTKISLLMVHAQDHLMNAMTVRDLAVELVDILGKGMIENVKN